MRFSAFLLFMLAAVFGLVLMVMEHEQAHAQINTYYGCSSKFGMSWQSFYEMPICPKNMSESSYLSLIQSQSVVDAFGYQLYSIYWIMFFVLVAILFKGGEGGDREKIQ